MTAPHTATRASEVTRVLTRIAETCDVEPVWIRAWYGTLWLETSTTSVGTVGVRLIAARVTIRDHADGAFLAAVLRLPQDVARPYPCLLCPSSSCPHGLCSGPSARWCGWLAGDDPHVPVSITVDCEAGGS